MSVEPKTNMDSTQNTTTINGITVHFPYTPYTPQINYMSSVIKCLQQSQNALLESPTGTGKTLSLLCASLSWLFQSKKSTEIPELPEDDNFPQIIYSSRTHSQLTHVISEFKQTIFADKIKSAVVGSRDQLCIHPTVTKESSNNAKVNACRLKVRSRSCHYYNRVEVTKNQIHRNEVMDIEDLVKKGRELTCCPYYLARELKQHAEIIFMPYNYLIDPRLRAKHGVEIRGNVLIFDEGHNLERVCEESLSFDLFPSLMAGAVSELTTFMDWLERIHTDNATTDEPVEQKLVVTAKEVMRLKMKLLKLEKIIQSHHLDKPRLVREGSYIYDIYTQAGFVKSNAQATITLIDDKLVQPMSSTSSLNVKSRGYALSHFSDTLKILFSDFVSSASSCFYRVLIYRGEEGSDKILSYWCFTADCSLMELFNQNVRSVILTSGTLDPQNLFTGKIMNKFPVQLQCGHVVSPDNFTVSIVSKGCDGVELTSSYSNRSNDSYIQSLGNTIFNIIKVIPGGVLIFFPSYSNMEFCLTQWKKTNIYTLLNNTKPIFTEFREKSDLKEENKLLNVMEKYYQQIRGDPRKAAIFMAVCRGKVSEGLDFMDDYGRAVIMTGIPYASYKEARVEVKMGFIDETVSVGRGRVWYNHDAIRAVNQSIGRIIRHRHDYGAIILLDKRFCSAQVKSKLPTWLNNGIREFDNFGRFLRHLSVFFRGLKSSQNVTSQPDQHEKSPTESVRVNDPVDEPVIPTSTKRTRYVVKPRDVGDTSITSKYFQKSSSDSFLLNAKRIMTAEEYSRLSAAISHYCDTSDFDSLRRELEDLITNDRTRGHVLSFRSFLRSDHVELFDSAFRSGVGLSWDCMSCLREKLCYPLRGVCSHVLCLPCWKMSETDDGVVCRVCSAMMARSELIVLNIKKDCQ